MSAAASPCCCRALAAQQAPPLARRLFRAINNSSRIKSSNSSSRSTTAAGRPLLRSRTARAASTPAALRTRRAVAAAAAAAAAGMATPAGAASGAQAEARDHSSQANTDAIREVARRYELDVDFKRRLLEGYARITLEAVRDGVREVVLDTRDLEVTRCELLISSPEAPDDEKSKAPPAPQLSFALGARHKALGAPLTIALPAPLAAGARVMVGVRFATSPESTALQFLDPAQTAGGKRPYLFSQCQAIHARSMVPCQDSPAVKAPYTAAVRAPADLTALMSAVPADDGDEEGTRLPGVDADGAAASASTSSEAKRVHRFKQAVPVPSYLIALAVGDLASRELSPRTRVWSEPSVVEAAAYEFADTAAYLEAGEALAGPYAWGRYDLLLLPPSFPYGGMENPCLTFVTPTLLAGDRSLTNVVAHEIAHSWSGNLVTNASWQDFFLNEGWTVYLERRILGRLRGAAAMHFAAARGAAQLAEEVARIGPGHNFTRLVPDLSAGEDPDDAFSRVPYEKGFYLLWHLQELVGGEAAFDPFIKAYFKEFAFKTLTSADFVAFFTRYFEAKCPAVKEIDWDAWLHAPGMPPVTNSYDASLAAAADALAARWHTADVMGVGGGAPAGAGAGDIEGWSSDQVVAFLSRLSELRSLTPLHPSVARALTATYSFDKTSNAEIRFEWLKLCVAAREPSAVQAAVAFLGAVGRMKYLRPLYRALVKSGQSGRDAALAAFEANKDKYHPIARKMAAADLGVEA